MANYVQPEQIWDISVTTAVDAGDVILLGDNDDLVSVAVTDIPANGDGSVYVAGVLEFATDVTTFEQGDEAYYNASTDKVTATNTDVWAGKVVKALTGAVRVAINFGNEVTGS